MKQLSRITLGVVVVYNLTLALFAIVPLQDEDVDELVAAEVFVAVTAAAVAIAAAACIWWREIPAHIHHWICRASIILGLVTALLFAIFADTDQFPIGPRLVFIGFIVAGAGAIRAACLESIIGERDCGCS